MGTNYKKVADMPEGMRQARKRRLKANIQKRNFEVKCLDDKFKMIAREADQYHARILFAKLTHEEQLEFIRKNHRGVKVKFDVSEYESFNPATFRLQKGGFHLNVFPVVNGKNFWVILARYPDRPTDEQILHKIQHHLPTVRIL